MINEKKFLLILFNKNKSKKKCVTKWRLQVVEDTRPIKKVVRVLKVVGVWRRGSGARIGCVVCGGRRNGRRVVLHWYLNDSRIVQLSRIGLLRVFIVLKVIIHICLY